MERLAHFARIEFLVLGAGLLLGIIVQLLSGRIRLAGVFDNKASGTFDPGRFQLFLFSLFAGARVLHDFQQSGGSATPPTFAVSQLLYLFGGSNALYLVRKYFQLRPKS